ncbi:hypothetical protein PP914_gp135 [Arthrobacter phage Qui]|uniref:Uncharacterized protein n=1 Tax=Arthrobacter phage Qui TaxID=2603260 RepID=A0A5B8WFZ0_9CAUD|nr:hypothetical protein PP914_gp135 [Arthrobacter phage Qui]QED11624.1 hypothetical protein SEA_QUI_135 [Arthrobacter phage Qui]QOC56456.1 hypothetical protein SEA_PAELLA_135 [Arthrobacter phage Paella]
MAVEYNDYGYVITVKCQNPQPHTSHSWREGFLWRTKKKCDGVPVHLAKFPEASTPAEVPMQIIDHKHDFKLTDEFPFGPKEDSDILWVCDWLDCKHYFVIDRDLWWIDGVKYDTY